MDRYWPAGGSKALPTLTLPGFRFAADQSRLLEFLVFLNTARAVFEPMHQNALLRRTALEQSDEHQRHSSSPLFWPLPQTLYDYESHETLIQEMLVTRFVDNFLAYVSDLLALIYKTRPEMLKSSEQEAVEFILQFSDMDDLRAAIAEKRVEKLAYLGLKSLNDYLAKHANFPLVLEKADLERAAVLVEYRNMIVHNRAVVGNPSVRRFPQLSEKLGRRLNFSFDELRADRQFMEHIVLDVDVRAAQKFSLPVTTLPEPP